MSEEELTQSETEVVEEEVAEEAPASAGPRLVLKRAGQETDEVFPVNPPSLIGRFDPAVGPIDIDLANIVEANYISRKHARIEFEEGVYTIEDLGSSNGTFILREDFERIEVAPLADGDEIAFGNVRFVFHVD